MNLDTVTYVELENEQHTDLLEKRNYKTTLYIA